MKFLDCTFETPEENLACDEALLDLCEDGLAPEILRFWEPHGYFVVAGYSNKIRTEVHWEECEKQNVPILRRPSGGGTVLQGPGCLNYSLILQMEGREEFKSLTSTTQLIMETHAKTLSILLSSSRHSRMVLGGNRRFLSPSNAFVEGPRLKHSGATGTKSFGDDTDEAKVRVQGISDLVIHNLKFSGNAQRRKKSTFLFHGTFLLNFDLNMIETLLAMPNRRPSYRKGRPHSEFLTNINIPSALIKGSLLKTWNASEKFQNGSLPHEQIRSLVREKYSCREWNFKF